jgi:hypothetical protein
MWPRPCKAVEEGARCHIRDFRYVRIEENKQTERAREGGPVYQTLLYCVRSTCKEREGLTWLGGTESALLSRPTVLSRRNKGVLTRYSTRREP